MKINISYTSEMPMYEQIEHCIREAAFSGELEHNSSVPSVRQLAADLNVSTITVKRAYSDLEREGLLYTVSGKGTFVRTDNITRLCDEREKQLMSQLEECVTMLRGADVPEQRVMDAVKQIYDKGDNSDE